MPFYPNFYPNLQLWYTVVHLRLTFSYVFEDFSHEGVTIGSEILDFFMEFKDLSDTNLDLATLTLSFFSISMLLYGKWVKLAGFSHF